MMQAPENLLTVFANPESQNPAPSSDHARPMRFVYRDENGVFKMNPEATDVLRRVKGPIAVVSVCGPACKGKSFLLNHLLGKISKFQVAPSHRQFTEGIWMWSAPVKQTALDGTEYSLLLLDMEGIDSCDQMDLYRTQIFSSVILLSSLLIYNQIGSINETALDHLSIVAELTKLIHVDESGGRTTLCELGPFSLPPIFVWLLRDFYLDLNQGKEKITPRDYLEQKLRPLPGDGNDLAVKNQIRESIRALFTDRECFGLGFPFNNGNDPQHIERISLENLHPEFQTGLDALTKYVFGRTRPKQVGGAIMTGPILAGITKYFLDALKNGSVPTISSSWQSVEESECKRAYDEATEVYLSAFDSARPPEEAFLREAHDEAVKKSLVAFNMNALGTGSARQKYEVLLHNFFTGVFEDYKRNAFREADLRCLNAIQGMEKKLQAASHVPDAKVDHVVTVLDGLVSVYEASVHGPTKWKMLCSFLQKRSVQILKHLGRLTSMSITCLVCLLKQPFAPCWITSPSSSDHAYRNLSESVCLSEQILPLITVLIHLKLLDFSLQDVILNQAKKQIEQVLSENSNLLFKGRSVEDKIELLNKQLEASEKFRAEYQSHYENSIDDFKKLAGYYERRIIDLDSKCTSLEERCSSLLQTEDSARQEFLEWKRRYEELLSKKSADDCQLKSEIEVLKSRCRADGAKSAAANVKVVSAQTKANEWKEKFGVALREVEILKSNSGEAEEKTCAANGRSLPSQNEAAEWEDKYVAAVKEAKAANEKALSSQKELNEWKAKFDAADEISLSAQKELIEWKDKYCDAVREAQTANENSVSVQKEAIEWKDKFDAALREVTTLKTNYEEAEERIAATNEIALSARKEAVEWKEGYDIVVTEARAANEKVLSAQKEANEWRDKFDAVLREVAIFKSSSGEAEEKTSDANANALSAQKDATEWKDKYNSAVTEAKTALQEAATLQESVNALQMEFFGNLAEKDEEINEVAELVDAGQHFTTLSSELKAAESGIESCDLKSEDLRLHIKDLCKLYEVSKDTIESLRIEARLLVQQKTQLKEQLFSQIEKAEKHIKSLEGEKLDLLGEIEKHRLSSEGAKSKLALLEATVKEKEGEIESLLKANNKQLLNSAQVQRIALESEFTAHMAVKTAVDAPSTQIEIAQRNVDFLWQELTPNFLDEAALESQSKRPHGKRSRPEAPSECSEMAQSMDIGGVRVTKRTKSPATPHKCTMSEDVVSFSEGTEGVSGGSKVDSGNYTKFTIARLRADLAEQGFGSELRQLRSRKKKDILELYEKLVLHI
ncbi:hypothetical protein SLEP1_g6667 [Rubroshorea leprosula]|uniref:GB1/RHD3-type G domain-containing protein n=1 Tax=Rubroshorea leprosula TaxID=152421 RepID=A0AAV5I5S8_9ROSI|nr:hypothetical protein SLEP1_g6667 [Rubroshorea leprosula]